jgi:hypothetical protein
MLNIVETKSHNNKTFSFTFKTTKRSKCKAACPQELVTHHHQLPKVLSPSAFSG